MFEKVLSKDAKQALGILGKSSILRSAYLAGGTALALQIGHRYSYDFDFFTQKEFDEEILLHNLTETLNKFRLERKEWRTILGYMGDLRFSLFYYSYPLLFEIHNFNGITIANIKDISAMMLAAIADRGTKRDFIDLYFIFAVKKVLKLSEALELYERKFKTLKQNKVHILKSLVYFEDAERDEMPRMIKKVRWEKVKGFFTEEGKKAAKRLL